jgi:hypothetical protein
MYRDLDLWWSAARGDNFTTATQVGAASAQQAGYARIRTEAKVFDAQEPGTVPLNLFWSDARKDNFTTPTAAGQSSALAAGYVLSRVEGFVYPWRPATPVTPLRLWWSDARGDNFLTGTPQGDKDAAAAGYRYVRTEGYAPSPQGLTVTVDKTERTEAGVFHTVRGSGFAPAGQAQFYFVPDTVPADAPFEYAYQLIEAIAVNATGAIGPRRMGGKWGFSPKGDPFGTIVARDRETGVEIAVTRL